MKKIIYALLLLVLFNIHTTPTKQQVLYFLAQDQTDQLPSDTNCGVVANYLISKGYKSGFNFYRMRIDFNNGTAHMINVIDTTEGRLYIEPQNDQIYFVPTVGEFLCSEEICLSLDEWRITKVRFEF